MLLGCSKGKPVESANLTTDTDSYSYVKYENGSVESKKKNDYEEIQSQEDFIEISCMVAKYISQTVKESASQNDIKASSFSDVNLLGFINSPWHAGDANPILTYKINKSVRLSEAKEKLSKLNEIPFLKYQKMRHEGSESIGSEETTNKTVIIRNGNVICAIQSEMKDYRKN